MNKKNNKLTVLVIVIAIIIGLSVGFILYKGRGITVNNENLGDINYYCDSGYLGPDSQHYCFKTSEKVYDIEDDDDFENCIVSGYYDYNGACYSARYAAKFPVSSITVSCPETIYVGSYATLGATVLPSGAIKNIKWSSSDEQGLVVDGEGWNARSAHAIAPGAYIVTVKDLYTGVNGTCIISVLQLVESISLSQTSVYLNAGGTTKLTATVGPVDAANKRLNWVSSKPSVATVNNGLITAISNGEATITATAQDGSGISASARVVVANSVVLVSNIILENNSNSIDVRVDNTKPIAYTVEPSNATNKEITWQSADTHIATVDENGIVTGLAGGYSTTITATAKDNSGVKATITVNVTESPYVNSDLSYLKLNDLTSLSPTYYLAKRASDSDKGSYIIANYTSYTSSSILLPVDWSRMLISGNSSLVTVTGGDSVSYSGTYTFTAVGSPDENNYPVLNTYQISASKNDITKTDNVKIYVYCPWTPSANNGSGTYSYGDGTTKKDRDGMRYVSGCDAYENAQEVGNQVYYDNHYNRCCGTTPVVTYACYGDGQTLATSTKVDWRSSASSEYPYLLSSISHDECVINTVEFACYGDGQTLATSSKVDWRSSASSEYPYKLDNVLEGNCVINVESNACYKDQNGKLVWGKYANNSNYTLVSSIDNSDDCRDVDVPNTYSGFQNIIYIFLPIFLSFGAGLIYWNYKNRRYD